MHLTDESHHRYSPPRSPSTCAQGHRSSLILQTLEGGSICLVCLSNLISNSKSLTLHVSYALSQISHALSQPQFLHVLLTYHPYFLVAPLVAALSSFEDEPIAKQIVNLISDICGFGDSSVYAEFVARISGLLSSGALAWSCRHVYTLHCLGVLLDYRKNYQHLYIKDKYALVSNLVTGLQLPSEVIQGEVLFVLYKISLLQHEKKDDDGIDVLSAYCPKLLHLSLEVLMKTESDDVRLNCVALLSVLAQRGLFVNACANGISSKDPFEADNFMQTTMHVLDGPSLNLLFAEAIKAPLLSSDTQVQIGTLDLIFLYLSWESDARKQSQILIEENIADYVFENLRLSGCKDPVVSSCLQVLDILSVAEQAFRQRLAIGFTSLVPVLRYVAEVPFHPVQLQTLKLIWNCISNCPGIVSTTHIDEIGVILTGMLKKHLDGSIGMLPETFTIACSVLVALMRSPSSRGTSRLAVSVQDVPRNALLTCLSLYSNHPSQLLHSLYLLKEAYAYSHEADPTNSSYLELRNCILDAYKTNLLPWFLTSINDIEEDIALGVLESLHSVLLQDSEIQSKDFANVLVSSSWFSYSFKCLGLFPTEKMKQRIYLMFSSIVDVLLGNDCGQLIRDAVMNLPTDPIDLLFVLGQKSFNNLDMFFCQYAVLLILHISSFYDDRLADDKMLLASLEQYIILNSSKLYMRLLNRGLAKMSYQIPYSHEAEKILFHLMAEKEWNIFHMRIHLTSLKWLFQQEKICKSLSNQVLKLCRCNSSFRHHMVVHSHINQNIDVHAIAELVASGDNFGAKILVCLLGELVEEGREEHDIISVLNVVATIVGTFPATSDQLCLHGIGGVIQNLYYHPRLSSSSETIRVVSKLIFGLLGTVQSRSLSGDETWHAVTIKLMDYLIHTVAIDGWTQECLIVLGILSLILQHSSSEVLVEASKTILLSDPLVSVINNTIYEACSKGPALADCNVGTKTRECLIFVLLLYYYSLRSVHAIFPGTFDWQSLLDDDSGKRLITVIRIHCHDLCRLMHFGPPMVKLITSFCLLELFNRITDQKSRKSDHLKCRERYLPSLMAILEGLVFCSDIRVAMNCALCLSVILCWGMQDMETRVIRQNNWCRLIVEELVMSLATPCLASKSFMVHHKPAVHVAVSLLKLHKIPQWMTCVLDDDCISGIIQNLSSDNVTCEMVLLFRELLNRGYLNSEHIAGLNQVFQACRKCMYDYQDASTEDDISKVAVISHDSGKVCEFLINLMSSQHSRGVKVRNKGLLEEIELFCKSLAEENGG
ncbi:hypothetical protein RJ639_034657 [Escallonia herrerae]|uniref:Protein PRD1 n=1 Tax=Escallonia herrerae TaxID=1293975 RepID=A0AA88WU48_9ASTE|nr:hypothetical protein RJ639_034657 [Escallonia herrerae]